MLKNDFIFNYIYFQTFFKYYKFMNASFRIRDSKSKNK